MKTRFKICVRQSEGPSTSGKGTPFSSQVVSKVQLSEKGCDPQRRNFQLLSSKFETSNASYFLNLLSTHTLDRGLISRWILLEVLLSPSPSVLLNFSSQSIDLGIGNFLHHSTESNLKEGPEIKIRNHSHVKYNSVRKKRFSS